MLSHFSKRKSNQQVLEIFDEAAKKVVLSIYPNYERIAADIKVLYPV